MQVSPVSRPPQVNVTESAKEPKAVTLTVVEVETLGTLAITGLVVGAPKVKSTTCRVTLASWVVVTASVPTAWMLNSVKSPTAALDALIVNAAPAAVGVTGVVTAAQLDGVLPVQLRFTGEAYPAADVSVPLKAAVWLGYVVKVGVGMAIQ